MLKQSEPQTTTGSDYHPMNFDSRIGDLVWTIRYVVLKGDVMRKQIAPTGFKNLIFGVLGHPIIQALIKLLSG